MIEYNWTKEYRNDIPSFFTPDPVEGYIYYFNEPDNIYFENNMHIYKNTDKYSNFDYCMDIDGVLYESDDLSKLEAILWNWCQNTK